MKRLVIAAMLLVLTAPMLSQTTGPILKWAVPSTEAANPQKVSLDGAAFNQVTTTATTEGDKTWLRYTFPTPLAPQSHTFKVQSCNAIACVDSDPLTVSPPTKPGELSLQ